MNAKLTVENTNDTYSSNTFSMVELLSNIDKTNNGLIVDNTADQNLRYVGSSPKTMSFLEMIMNYGELLEYLM